MRVLYAGRGFALFVQSAAQHPVPFWQTSVYSIRRSPSVAHMLLKIDSMPCLLAYLFGSCVAIRQITYCSTRSVS